MTSDQMMQALEMFEGLIKLYKTRIGDLKAQLAESQHNLEAYQTEADKLRGALQKVGVIGER